MGLVLLAALWQHVRALSYTFFADDYLFLDQTRGGFIGSIWTVHDPLRNYWRPLSRQVYFWAVTMLGESPVVAHAFNLMLFLVIVALVFLIARRISGPIAGVVAAAILALHEVADVPVFWASGSQDLLAVAGALGALELSLRGKLRWAALPFLAGLLSKETVVVTPLIATWMLREPGERWTWSLRRVAPLWITLAAWLPVWAVMMTGGAHQGLHFGIGSIPAAIVHLPQAFLGAQWDVSAPLPLFRAVPAVGPLALLLAAVAIAWWSAGRAAASPRSRDASPPPRAQQPPPGATRSPRGVAIGLVWGLLAALPVAIVVHVWCSYYYLYASCGLALAVGAWASLVPAPAAFAAVALLAWGSENARQLESFATRPDDWGTQSHLSRFYFDRSLRWVSRYLEDLRAQQPSVPPHSTLYFTGIPAFASWQSGDGALVRWVYRDSTVRSYYASDFSLQRARRGEVFIFTARHDSLVAEGGGVGALESLAIGQALSEHFQVAHDAVTRALDFAPADKGLHYWRAWLGLALGDSTNLTSELRAAGCWKGGDARTDAAAARRLLNGGDKSGALERFTSALESSPMDAVLHAEVGDLLLELAPRASATGMEALAVRMLAPDSASSWRRWGKAQAAAGHPYEAYASMTRYFELAGPAGARDTTSVALYQWLRASLPGGELAQRELRRRPGDR